MAWLSSPEAYRAAAAGGPAGRDDIDSVTRIDTHASVIFLAGSRALKLKRAVRYDYLDYSTVERRRLCCADEVRLNRRTAPMLYRGVRAVTRTPDGRFEFDGSGRVVDWLVEMNRFDPESQLDQLATRRMLDIGTMSKLADAVARLHDVAEWRFDQGGLDGLSWVIEGNRKALRQYGHDVLDQEACDQVYKDSGRLLRHHGQRLEDRRLAGYVRHCHGDLHLGNVCLVDDVPVLFDGVEFSTTIACVDVLYDLAFVVMDLLHRGLDQHANALFNRYLQHTRDIGGLRLLPLFLATRSAVRAKTSATAASVQPDGADAETLRRSSREYLALAQHLLTPRDTRLVVVGGGSGAGKTTLARGLAASVGPPPGALVLRSDVERKRLMGVSPDTRLGPDGYTQGVTHEVYRRLAEQARLVLREGHAVIVDAVCGSRLERATLAEVAREIEVPFNGLWLNAPLATLTSRLASRTGDASDATAPVAARQLERDSVPSAWAHLDASRDATSVLQHAQQALAKANR